MQAPQTEIIATKDGAEILRQTVRPGEYVIGREQGCDVLLDVDLVSRRHAQLTVNYDHVLIEDLGSSNGTFVNGKPVTASTRLWPNQKIQIGVATVELHRVKTEPPPDVSLAPQTAAVQRLLPEELLRDKKYDIGGVVAQGGMGAILDAREAAIERRVAMKVMLDGSSPDDLTRFVAEAKITGQLEHPSIVPIYELSVDENGQPFYTMKMVRGITLRKVLELLAGSAVETVAKYPLPALLTIFQKVCDALAFAHSRGVIHRDLKPENIMLDDFGVVLVMDWGLAKLVGKSEPSTGASLHSRIRTPPPEASGATLAGTIMGTPAFMSPEQARGEVDDLDARSDLYALGAILYQILCLRPPVTGRTAMEIVDKVGRGEIEPLTHPQTVIPDSLAAVVRKAMAFEREQRYGSVEELQRDLTAYQSGFATEAEQAGLWKQFTLLVKRNKSAALGIAAVLTIGAVFGTKAIVEGRRAEREAVRANQALLDLKSTAPDLLALAAREAALQHFESALNKTDAVIALDPALLPAYWRRGWLLLAEEKYDAALAALRLAVAKDPANRQHAALIPLVEKLAVSPAEKRHEFDLIKPLYDHLSAVGAVGEATPLLPHLKLGNEARLAVVKEHVQRWLGKPGTDSKAPYSVTIYRGDVNVTLNGFRLADLEPLRGLPIDSLHIEGCGVTSLEPLRGMGLRRLDIARNQVEDLNPLEGMPMTELIITQNPISDLSPLRGIQRCPKFPLQNGVELA